MKNLKKISIIFYIFFAINANSQTDKGFYINVQSGYNKGTAGVNYLHALLLNSINRTETSATTSESKAVALTLGDGINIGANLGYMLNKNLGFELGVNYLLGDKIKSSFTSYTGDYSNDESALKMIQIKPTLVFRAGFEKINPYAKIGMLIGSGKITNTQSGKKSSDTYTQTREFSGGTSIGFHGALGTLYKISEKLSLFGELNLTSLEYSPLKGTTTVSTENDIDQLPLLPIREKEIEFVESIINTGFPDSPNETNKILKIPFSFSSFGLNVGLQYHF